MGGTLCGRVEEEFGNSGIWFGKKLHTEEHLVFEGGRACGEVEGSEGEQPLTMEDCDTLISTPHDPTGTVLPEVHAQERELGSYKLRRVKLTKNIFDKFVGALSNLETTRLDLVKCCSLHSTESFMMTLFSACSAALQR